MTTGYSRTPRILKGALIELTEPFLGPVPNIIPFQYNSDKLTRKFTPWAPAEAEEGQVTGADPLSQPFDPAETISLELELDATDALEQPEANPVAALAGVADRLAALEKLIYPASAGVLGGLGDAIGGLLGADIVPRRQVPVVLFVWGPGRIVPVRVTKFEIVEQAFSPTLYPVMAKVTADLRVLTPSDFERPGHQLSLAEQIAVTSYRYTLAQKEILARAGLLTNVDSILGLLPF